MKHRNCVISINDELRMYVCSEFIREREQTQAQKQRFKIMKIEYCGLGAKSFFMFL